MKKKTNRIAGSEILPIKADLCSQESIPSIIDETLATFGQIDIINNAGTIRRDEAKDFTEKDWDDVINGEFKVSVFLSQAVAREFIKNNSGGKINNVASMLSYQGGIRCVLLIRRQTWCCWFNQGTM